MWKTGDYNYTTNALNQYIASNGQELTYDFDGNMLTRDGWTQTWDSENRIIQTVKGNTKLEFSYDYMGRRIEKKVFENNILISHYRFVYDNYKLVEELDALNENSVLKQYVWQPSFLGVDVPLIMFFENSTYYYFFDANKNITVQCRPIIL